MKTIYLSLWIVLLQLYANCQLQLTNFGNLQIHPGAQLNCFGNFVNNGTFIDNGLNIIFNGSTLQTISGASTLIFSNLTVNNNSGVVLNQNLVVSNTLTLENGSLDLNSKTLTINNNSSSAISRTNGYIISEKTDNSSKLEWNIGSATGIYTFPFGNASSVYIPFILNLGSGNIGKVTVSTFPTAPDNTPYPVSPDIVTHVNDIFGNDNSINTVDRFWQIDKDGPGGVATLTFTASPSEVGSITNLYAQRWNSANIAWDPPLAGQTNNAISATVPDVSDFSPWTLTGNGSFLPITLLDFEAKRKNIYAELNWVTASETGNDGFEIEKSTDLMYWKKIAFVNGAGNSNEIIYYNYNDLLTENIQNRNSVVYYRLKQIDFNGKYSYSAIKFIDLNAAGTETPVLYSVYPNPAVDVLFISCNQAFRQYQVKIYSNNGIQLYDINVNGTLKLNISQLLPATYIVVVHDIPETVPYYIKFVKIPAKL